MLTQISFRSREQFERMQRLVALDGLKMSCSLSSGVWFLRIWENCR